MGSRQAKAGEPITVYSAIIVEENSVAVREGKDNFDGSYKIDTNLLNKKKKKAQFVYLNSICFL